MVGWVGMRVIYVLSSFKTACLEAVVDFIIAQLSQR